MLSDDGVVVVVVYSHNPSQLRIFIVYLYMLSLWRRCSNFNTHISYQQSLRFPWKPLITNKAV